MSSERRHIDYVDEETGEYIYFLEIREGDTLRTKEQNDYFFDKLERYADKTDFVWLKFAYNNDFYASISPENLTRLMYFATFCNNEGYVMTDTDIKTMLGINSNQVKSFRDAFFGRAIIKEGERLYLKDDLFGKGKIGVPNRDYVRLFTGVTRQLYKRCETTSEHAYLSYFFRMIPFVNRQTNILCCSQHEQDREHIAYMTTTEFFNLIGRTHHGRIKTQLQTYRVCGELLIGFFDTLDTLSPRGNHAIINPILYYGGDRTKQNYADIRKLFTDEKEAYLSSQT
ncbi:MAG: hypothetical protein IKY21_03900 [Clostridia bacterium]|nr:hypothetical protein [Clostridia bacterium]